MNTGRDTTSLTLDFGFVQPCPQGKPGEVGDTYELSPEGSSHGSGYLLDVSGECFDKKNTWVGNVMKCTNEGVHNDKHVFYHFQQWFYHFLQKMTLKRVYSHFTSTGTVLVGLSTQRRDYKSTVFWKTISHNQGYQTYMNTLSLARLVLFTDKLEAQVGTGLQNGPVSHTLSRRNVSGDEPTCRTGRR